MSERRFTDKQIGLILKRAVELDEGSAGGDGRGLSLTDLESIAAEAGIDPGTVGRAIAEMDRRKGLDTSTRLVPPAARTEVRTLPRRFSPEEIAELMRVVDQEVNAQGTVVEALGGVRWTSTARFINTQVSVDPSGEDTILRVEEHYSDMIRGPLHGAPGGWGAMVGLIVGIETFSLAAPLVILLCFIGAMVGLFTGNMIWRSLSHGSHKRVQALADKLTVEASRMLPPGESELDSGLPEE